jgi:hypothetical protein
MRSSILVSVDRLSRLPTFSLDRDRSIAEVVALLLGAVQGLPVQVKPLAENADRAELYGWNLIPKPSEISAKLEDLAGRIGPLESKELMKIASSLTPRNALC